MTCISYSEFNALHQMGTCGTIHPKPRRSVAFCAVATEKATKKIRIDMPKPEPMNSGQLSYCENARLLRIERFEKMKGHGPMQSTEIANFLGISRSSVTCQAEKLALEGILDRVKESTRLVTYAWVGK